MARFGRAPSTRPPHVLIVCTGNVCRSPFIATRLGDAVPTLVVRSAGTAALHGAPPTEEVRAALEAAGLTGRGHVGRQLTRGMVRDADLVVTATRAHRLAVNDLSADAAACTFTLKELARLLPDAVRPGVDLHTALGRVAAVSQAENIDHDDDLADPYGLEADAYALMFQEVRAAVAVVGPALADLRP